MKKFFLFSLLCFSVLNTKVWAQGDPKNVVEDPNAEVRSVANFTGIAVKSATVVYIAQGTENAVAVSAGEGGSNDNIVTEVKNGILSISYKSGTNWKNNKGIRAYITVANLQILDISGASVVKFVNAVEANGLKIDVSGASVFKGEVKGSDISLDASGASSVSVTGKVAQARLLASGASSVKAYELICSQKATVDASGASTAQVNAENKITIKASGASSVKYRGSADNVTEYASGASSIKSESAPSSNKKKNVVTVSF